MDHSASFNRSGRFLVLVFTAVIGSFLGSSLLNQYVSAEIGGLSERLATNTAPSIELLASVRSSALVAERELSRQLLQRDQATTRRRPLEQSLQRLEASLRAYLLLPLTEGEQPVHDDVQQSWARFEEAVRHVKQEADEGNLAQARQSMRRVDFATAALVQSSMHAIEFNARHGQILADQIRATRARSVLIANVLTVLCALLGVIGAILLYRQAVNYRVLSQDHARDLESRADELEHFASRMAHDIRGPLTAASFATEVLVMKVDDPEAQRLGELLRRNIARASSIMEALLDFARSGAKPDPNAASTPRDLIEDLAPQLDLEARERDVELVWEPIPAVLVACSDGVYLSLISNLVRNAIKYMGDATTRRVTVAVRRADGMVRTEVADTGPGVRAEILEALFEPYVRGDEPSTSDGIGLGLPTVKKLAESHHGAAGVSSIVGEGSVFWFELPEGETAPEAPRAAARG